MVCRYEGRFDLLHATADPDVVIIRSRATESESGGITYVASRADAAAARELTVPLLP